MKAAAKNRGFVLMMVVVTLFLLAAIALMLSRESIVAIDLNRSIQEQDAASYAAEAGLQHAQWAANTSNCGTYANIPATPVGAANSATYSASYSALSGSPVEVTATGSSPAGASATQRRLLRSFSAPSSSPISATGDAFIEQVAQAQNFGSNPNLNLSSVPGDLINVLLKFPAPPPSSTLNVVSARLRLYHDGSGSDPSPITANVYPINSEWVEGSVSWLNAKTGLAWASPGGDFSLNPQATATIDATVAGAVEWDVTNIVRPWLKGQTSHGMLVKLATSNRAIGFASRENSNLANHPQLILQTRCECGYVCEAVATGCSADYTPQETRLHIDAAATGGKKPGGITFVPSGAIVGGVAIPAGGGTVYASESSKSLTAYDSSGAHISTLGPLALQKPTGLTWVGGGPQAQNLLLADESLQTILVYDPSGVNIASINTSKRFATVSGISYIGATASGAYTDDLLIVGTNSVLGISLPAAGIYSQNLRQVQKSIPLPLGTGVPSGVVHLPGTDKFLLATQGSAQVLTLNFDGQLLAAYNAEAIAGKDVSGLAINTENCDHLLSELASNSLYALYPGLSCSLKYGDDFESGTYSGSTGLSNWAASPWVERGENDGPTAGDVRLLTLDGETGLAVSGSTGAMRALDLSGTTTVKLNLDMRALSIEGGEKVTFDISRDGPTGLWDTLAEIGGPAVDEKSSGSFDISAYASANTHIRLRPSATFNADDTAMIDNLKIEICN